MPPGKGCCTRCGDCCDPIHTGWLNTDIEDDNINVAVRTLWVEISLAEANERRAQRRGAGTAAWTDTGGHYYRCTAFDPETRLCTIQGTKPPVCSEFPYYGGELYGCCILPTAELLGVDLNACGYWLDVPVEQLPPFVSLASIRKQVRAIRETE